VPTHNGTLAIGGAVGNPTTLTLEDLRALPVHDQAVTLECAGNGRLDMRPLPTGEPWGDYAVSTARWTGALLGDVLALAQPASQGVEVRFEGADHGPYHLQAILPETNQNDLTFVRALPIAEAVDPSSAIMVAYEMNGEPLTPDHGAPFRIIAPHWYAVASVKWLSRIDVLTEPFTGEFQTGHYIYQWPDRPHEAVRLMRLRARITDPAPGAILPLGPYTVRGKAWSGTGPITDVDISLTGEGDWHPAQLEPPKGPYQWQDWSFVWDSDAVGRHTLRARATDAAGHVQPDVPPWNRLGYGNNAIEVRFVDRH
jgi:DMSO/TMAO reductase YedYZ molybdopterin-dependent catalytic subunit